MPAEDIKPLKVKESDLYSIFNTLAGLFELQQKKAEAVVREAGVKQPELACYMQGVADQAKTAAWIMRKQTGQTGIVANAQYIFGIGRTIISQLDNAHEILRGITGGMPPIEMWDQDDDA